MEYFVEEYHVGNLIIQLSIQEQKGCRVIFTAKDVDNRRVWKTPVMDNNGKVKVYPNQQEAILDAKKKLSKLFND
jgi:hypothetical protein